MGGAELRALGFWLPCSPLLLCERDDKFRGVDKMRDFTKGRYAIHKTPLLKTARGEVVGQLVVVHLSTETGCGHRGAWVSLE